MANLSPNISFRLTFHLDEIEGVDSSEGVLVLDVKVDVGTETRGGRGQFLVPREVEVTHPSDQLGSHLRRRKEGEIRP